MRRLSHHRTAGGGSSGRWPAALAAWLLSAALVLVAPAAARAMKIERVTGPKSGVVAWLVEDHTVPLIAMNFS
ncbi:MAG TPA: hypothetical protein ENK13_04075, partial [Thermopetrobacter sp.]|nr:hypothetical protein [Thermopetrobacter sp.]